MLGPVPLGRVRLKLSLGKVVGHLLDHLLIFVEELVVHQERNVTSGLRGCEKRSSRLLPAPHGQL